MGQHAVGEADLTDQGTLLAGEQPPEDLPADARHQHADVVGALRDPQQPYDGIQQLVTRIAHHQPAVLRRTGRCLQQQRREHAHLRRRVS
nr:hypothetical protein [Kribbella sp. VKM Ac-2571]